MNGNGLVGIIFGKFDDYQEFAKYYFAAFLLKIFACKVNISLSEEKDNMFKGLSDFNARFVPVFFQTYQETSKKFEFVGLIDRKSDQV